MLELVFVAHALVLATGIGLAFNFSSVCDLVQEQYVKRAIRNQEHQFTAQSLLTMLRCALGRAPAVIAVAHVILGLAFATSPYHFILVLSAVKLSVCIRQVVAPTILGRGVEPPPEPSDCEMLWGDLALFGMALLLLPEALTDGGRVAMAIGAVPVLVRVAYDTAKYSMSACMLMSCIASVVELKGVARVLARACAQVIHMTTAPQGRALRNVVMEPWFDRLAATVAMGAAVLLWTDHHPVRACLVIAYVTGHALAVVRAARVPSPPGGDGAPMTDAAREAEANGPTDAVVNAWSAFESLMRQSESSEASSGQPRKRRRRNVRPPGFIDPFLALNVPRRQQEKEDASSPAVNTPCVSSSSSSSSSSTTPGTSDNVKGASVAPCHASAPSHNIQPARDADCETPAGQREQRCQESEVDVDGEKKNA